MNHITSLSTCGQTVIEVNRYRLRLLKRQIKRGLNDQTNNKTIEIKYIGAGNVAQIDIQFGHSIISEMNDLQDIFSRDTL